MIKYILYISYRRKTPGPDHPPQPYCRRRGAASARAPTPREESTQSTK